jgi:hypothetical protein
MANPRVAIVEANWDLPKQDLEALAEWHRSVRDVTKLDELEHSLSALVTNRRERAA